MALSWLDKNVYDAALERVGFVYDNCDDVVLSMSGGKDSTALMHLALTVAAERQRLPIKVMWLDQEAEWQATGDFMAAVMRRPDVVPFWYQFPFRLTNSLSAQHEYLHCWDPQARADWIREPDPISIKENPLPFNRFHPLIANLARVCDVEDRQHVGVLVGMRTAESLTRRMTIGFGTRAEIFKGVRWCSRPRGNTRVFWPIYDWSDQDVWACIARNGLAYNRIYDTFYRHGISGRAMRVSALIHETAWHSIKNLQEVEPRTYERYLRRVHGTNAFAHLAGDIMPKTLPAVFASWRDYRDYLLEHLIEPQYRELFRRRWARPSHNTGDPERWDKVHVHELMINDIDGTLSDNARAKLQLADRNASGYYRSRASPA